MATSKIKDKKEKARLNTIADNFIRLRYEIAPKRLKNTKFESDDITQKVLADAIKTITGIKIQNSRISAIEKAKDEPTLREVLAYKEFFNVTTDYLLGYTKSTEIEYDIVKFSKETGLSDNSIKILKNIKKRKSVDNILNKVISNNYGYDFEALLFHIKQFVELYEKDFYTNFNGKKLLEAKRRYSEKTGIPIIDISFKNIQEPEFDKILNNISTKQNNITEKLKLEKFNIEQYLSKILFNLVEEDK